PGPIDVSGVVNYNTVSGHITAIQVDPRDLTGNTIYVGTDNGGVWKTTNGGNDWKALTDNVVDANGQPVTQTSGGLALGVSSVPGQPGTVLYAGTGFSENSLASRSGVGILKSIDDGAHWTLVGQAQMTGARITKVVVNPNNANIVYVAVASYTDP